MLNRNEVAKKKIGPAKPARLSQPARGTKPLFLTIATVPISPEAAAPASPRRSLLAGPGDINRKRATLKIFAMEHFDGFVCFLGCGELNESKAARFTREFIEHEIHGGDNTRLREVLPQVVLHRLVSKITDE